MKINRLETHDRLLFFSKQADYISKGCEDCIKGRPEEFGNHPFYIYTHKREIDLDERIGLYNADLTESLKNVSYSKNYDSLNDVPNARLIWEPRLTKPLPQTSSMLFKAYPLGDHVKVIWIIPPRELWTQYKLGNMTENKTVLESIDMFINNPQKLALPEDDDLTDEQIDQIYREMSRNARIRKQMAKRLI